MVCQRFAICGIAAILILGREVGAQEDFGLRTSLDVPALSRETYAEGEAGKLQPIATANPTRLTVNPIEEPLPPRATLRPKWQPEEGLGIEAGGLTLFPLMRAGVIVSDNPGLVETGRKDDIGARLRPTLRITTDWIRHELNIEGRGDLVHYDDEPENNSKEVDADARLRLDVLRSTTLILTADFDLSEDNGADSNVPDTAIGKRTDYSFGGNAALNRSYGRLATTLLVGADWQYYGNVKLSGGGEEDNADRDYVQPQAVLRAGYEASSPFRPFVEAAYAPRFHFEDPDRNGFNRDSGGYRVAVGVTLDPSPIWSGEMALAYLWRNYSDSRLKTLDTFGLIGQVTWRPTELTALNLTLGTSLVETATAESSGAREWEARLGISHDLRDYLTVIGSVGLSHEDSQDTDETELKQRSSVGVLWRMNRWLAWSFDYDFIHNDNSKPDSDYYENRATTGLEIRR